MTPPVTLSQSVWSLQGLRESKSCGFPEKLLGSSKPAKTPRLCL